MEAIHAVWDLLGRFNIPEALLVLLGGSTVIKIGLKILKRSMPKSKVNPSLSVVIISFTRFVAYFGLALTVFTVLGLSEATKILSFLGGAMALGFAFGVNNIISNFYSGMMLAADDDFKIGYKVRIEGIEGVITHLDYRKIRFQDNDGNIHVFANKFVDEKSWVVLDRT